MQRHRELDSNKDKFVAEIPARCAYLIGVSGGRDSVALLDAIVDLVTAG
jgi:tRNA(Ile)-lysidine synthase TilS/MesJ